MPSKIRGGANDKHMADTHVPRVSSMAKPSSSLGFSPLTGISNPIVGYDMTSSLWQDAGRTVPATSNDETVAVWDDLVGANHAVVLSTEPPLKTNPYAGASKAILFDGVTTSFRTGGSISHGVGTGDFYWVAVCYSTNYNVSYKTLMQNTAFAPALYVNSSKVNLYWGADHTGATTLTNSTRYIIECVRSGGTVTYYINGTADANTFALGTSMSNATFDVGGNSDEWSGYLEAVWFYKTAPTAGQQTSMRTYYGF